ncbi:MAG TPA: BatA domain-containing protein [Edaphocola sp.]|nr:BatA domain-containing protein [Edaphocola sp.]
MGFLFPLFFTAALAVLVPIAIHLVNLRRYKRELFPNVRFLKQLQVVSKSSAKLHRRWLLFSRILFLAALVTAFAQPFLRSSAGSVNQTDAVRVLYIDNSFSMSAARDGQPLLTWAKNEALKLIAAGTPASRYVILSNDHMFLSPVLDQQAAERAVKQVGLSYKAVSLAQLKDLFLARDAESSPAGKQNFYLFSDFQAATLGAESSLSDSLKDLHVFLFPVRAKHLQNVFMDSAGIAASGNLTAGGKKIFYRIGRQEAKDVEEITLRVLLNGRTQRVSPVSFPEGREQVTDSFSFRSPEKAWTDISFILTDAGMSFDDTFRMVAHIPVGYAVLVLAEGGKISPYLRAAFGSMPDVSVKTISPQQFQPEQAKGVSLIVVQDGDEMTEALAGGLRTALGKGRNVLLFAGNNARPDALNNGLKRLADIQLQPLDTSREQVVVLQQEHPLVKGIFSAVPEQVQLPLAYRHFPVMSGLPANEQDVMSFADGSPMLAAFSFEKGGFYLVTSPLDGESSNFPLSYFFAPLLYRMTVPVAAGHQLLTTVGSPRPIWLPDQPESSDAGIWHIYRGRQDWIPAQKSTGNGLALYAGQSVTRPGFYTLKQEAGAADSFRVGVNTDPSESVLAPMADKALSAAFPGVPVTWLDARTVSRRGWAAPETAFPLWKLCVCIALLCLLLETWFLWRPSFLRKTGNNDDERRKGR